MDRPPVHGFRLSLAGLLAIVALCAFGLAGIVSATTFWTSSAATLTLGILLLAFLGAIRGDDVNRDFWAGFFLFGTAYLVLVEWDWIGGPFGHDLTAGLSDVADSIIPAATPLVTAPLNPAPAPLGAATPPPSLSMEEIRGRQIKIGNLVEISRLLLCLLFALAGGYLNRAVAARSRCEPVRAQARGEPSTDPEAPPRTSR